MKLTERLDDRTIEDMQGTSRIGPKTLEALARASATAPQRWPPSSRSFRRAETDADPAADLRGAGRDHLTKSASTP